MTGAEMVLLWIGVGGLFLTTFMVGLASIGDTGAETIGHLRSALTALGWLLVATGFALGLMHAS